ncbi:sensor histidine kinase [Vibrio ostreae]|uniref:histidine kinase n=1 Tax=Vibrio ostreae TaxID=2841925 RepID=A0A975YM33_9VIBR|nr:sensor histidine kinase [Vibrio ostreae]QXO16020.1 sensor histidine kinase [Vibrio ostreae]
MAKRNTSIRRQLFIMTLLVLTLINGIAIWTATLYAKQAANVSYDRLIHGAALQIIENTNLLDNQIVVDIPVSAFQTLALAPNDRAYYSVTTLDGRLLTGYSDLPQPEELPYPVAVQNSSLLTPKYYDAQYKGHEVRFITLSKQLIESDHSENVLVTLGQTTLARTQLANEMESFVIQFLIVFFCVTFSLLMFGIWQVLRPLKSLKRAIASRHSTELTPLNTDVPIEIRPLLETINFFMSQLDTTLERLKRFTSEAAHQLRTPLAGLNLQAQNALVESNPHIREKQLLDIIQSSALLSETVRHLLNEASVTHRLRSEVFLDISLDKITKDVCRSLVVWALESDVEIEYLGELEAQILGDEVALTQMLRNVLENAVKYSPQNSLVKVTLGQEDGRICLSIADQGIGISDEDKQHVFERFYRSEHNPTSGTGIGLSIAKEVANHHHALFLLEDNDPQGLIIKILFPEQEEQQ